MPDPRYQQLTNLLVSHSCALKKGDKILVESTEIPDSFLAVLCEEILAAGALPVFDRKEERLNRILLKGGSDELLTERLKLQSDLELHRMKQMDAYLGLRGSHNITELSDIPAERMKLHADLVFKPVHSEQRVKHTRWCVLRWPTPSMAQQAGSSTEAFEDFYFKVCSADYAKMAEAVKPLKALMDKTDKVRITARDTDLRFSIKGLNSIPCTGEMNIPDGECFTAPVRDSVNGQIQFNSSTIYRGTPFDDIRLVFKNGQVVEHSCSDDEALGKILDSDEGARYIGEFALGFHPFISKPMRDILFDEKIRGSLHLALGQAYEEADNSNRSSVHWDLVLLQEPGGEIYFDDVLIRKDGKFVLPELKGLNPEALG
ncbi:MAG: aminopeptidase [Vulcanimicrobiota bacterium]